MIVLPLQPNTRRYANTLLCRGEWGDLATLTALGTLESGTAIGNLQLDQPADFTGFAVGSTPGFRSVRSTNVLHHLIALVSTNATSAATWRVREGESQTESDGATVHDSSGNANHGTFQGGASYVDSGVGPFGGATRALHLVNPSTGTGQHVQMAASATLTLDDPPTAGWSYGGWVKTDYLRTADLLYHVATGGVRRVYLTPNSGVLRLALDGAGGVTTSQSIAAAFPLGSWVHVVVTRNETTGLVTFYVDAVACGGGTPGSIFGTSDGLLRLGSRGAAAPSGQPFDGYLADWRVYDYELSILDVLDWRAGVAPGGGLKARWQCGGFDSGSMPIWLASDLDPDWSAYHTFLYVPDGLSTRYQRIDCADASNPASNLRVGRYVCGEAVQFSRNRDHGMTLDVDDDGRPFADFRYALLPEQEWLTKGHQLVRTCRAQDLTVTPSGQTIMRRGKPVLAIFDPNDPAFGQHKTLYGALESRGGGKNTFHGLWEYECRLTGML